MSRLAVSLGTPAFASLTGCADGSSMPFGGGGGASHETAGRKDLLVGGTRMIPITTP